MGYNGTFDVILSGNSTICYGKDGPFPDYSPMKNMLIFHSYLELPEATETKQTETVRKAGWGGRMKTTSRGNG